MINSCGLKLYYLSITLLHWTRKLLIHYPPTEINASNCWGIVLPSQRSPSLQMINKLNLKGKSKIFSKISSFLFKVDNRATLIDEAARSCGRMLLWFVLFCFQPGSVFKEKHCCCSRQHKVIQPQDVAALFLLQWCDLPDILPLGVEPYESLCIFYEEMIYLWFYTTWFVIRRCAQIWIPWFVAALQFDVLKWLQWA